MAVKAWQAWQALQCQYCILGPEHWVPCHHPYDRYYYIMQYRTYSSTYTRVVLECTCTDTYMYPSATGARRAPVPVLEYRYDVSIDAFYQSRHSMAFGIPDTGTRVPVHVYSRIDTGITGTRVPVPVPLEYYQCYLGTRRVFHGIAICHTVPGYTYVYR